MAIANGNKIKALMVIAVIIVALLASAFGGYMYKASKCEEARADAIDKIRDEEKAKQEKVNEAAERKYQNLLTINRRLNADLNRVRQRAARISEESRAGCKGSTGAELSGPDAEFLTREAARADEIREGLRECYKYADTVAE